MRRGLFAGLALVFLVGGPVVAGGRLPLVAGDYTYELNGGTSNVTLAAFAGRTGPMGSMRFEGTWVAFGGPVTCVTVRGSEAWVAGSVGWGDALGLDGWMVRLVDHGTRDRAVAFVDEYDLAVAWCEGASVELDSAYLVPVTAGWVVVR